MEESVKDVLEAMNRLQGVHRISRHASDRKKLKNIVIDARSRADALFQDIQSTVGRSKGFIEG
jgi:hypothetical protein